MSSLDALLGVVDEPPKASEAPKAEPMESSISKVALDKLAEAESARNATKLSSTSSPSSTSQPESALDDQFRRIVARAKKLANEKEGGAGGSLEKEQAALKKEFDDMLKKLSTEASETLNKEQLKQLKEAAFGPLSFWITETKPIQEADRSGTLIRGNLRAEPGVVFSNLKSKLAQLFDGKYEAIMIEDPEASDRSGSSSGGLGGAGGPSTSVARVQGLGQQFPPVAFLIIPSSQAEPPQSTGFGLLGSSILGLLTIGSSLQLALASNVSKLPKETIEFFANPDNINSDQLPPGLENWDPTSYFETCIPVLAAVLAVQLAHESGHRIAASMKDVKLGPSFFVPYGQVGSFGAVTPFESMVRNHKELWDVAAAGPLAGFLVSSSLLAIGLAQSHGVDVQAAAVAVNQAAATASEVTAVAASGGADLSNLVPVPSELFSGSFLLGSLTRLALGEQAMKAGAEVLVSPLVVAGWCGMLSTALNVLPCGSLDGGRMIQGTFGRKTLALTSLFTYVGLGLGLLGGTLALPFGIFVIFTQRAPEKFIQDNVTPAGKVEASVTLAAVLLAILILLPVPPELADSMRGAVSNDPFIF